MIRSQFMSYMSDKDFLNEIEELLEKKNQKRQQKRKRKAEERKEYRRKKSEFVLEVADFFDRPKIKDILDETNEELMLYYFSGKFNWSRVYIEGDGVYEESGSQGMMSSTGVEKREKLYDYPRKLEEWYDILPYGKRVGKEHIFKPDPEEYIEDMEEKLMNLLEKTSEVN